MENLDLVYALFNQYLYQEAKNNIDLLGYYFNTNPATSGNGLITNLIDAIKTYPLDALDIPLFQSILSKTGKTAGESQKILSEIATWKNYGKAQMQPARKYLQDICAATIIKKAERLYTKSPSEYLKFLKTVDLKTETNDVLSTLEFSTFDINTMEAEGPGVGYMSRYEWINSSFEPVHGYENGQIVLFCAPPGTGKTLFGCGEALCMALSGTRVHYLAMGDMKPRDFVIRMGAIYSGCSFVDTTRNIKSIYSELSRQIGSRLGITVVPSQTVTIDEYIDYIIDKPYDVLFVDYDSNFKMEQSDNMYNDFGEIYGKLTKLTQLGKLVFIMAQPKVCAWQMERIEKDMVGESARKIHTVDIAITAGHAQGSPNPIGIMKIAKARRGDEGNEMPYYRLQNGRFKFISRQLYDELKSYDQRRIFTEDELDRLDLMKKSAMSGNGLVQEPQRQQQIANPFKKR